MFAPICLFPQTCAREELSRLTPPTGCLGKIVFFSQFTATPPRLHRCKRPSKLSNAIRVYSPSYWLEIFCTTNSSRVLARKRWQTFENCWKNTIFNEHPVAHVPASHSLAPPPPSSWLVFVPHGCAACFNISQKGAKSRCRKVS